ncbi:transcriptional repressor LexA [Heliorestis acidaminivorans]|uniref:LexA repressor n=1 Tax=Heliorestis acidaminivorans TaxID=553427 RepID=A0A6I0ETW2_9FIRM|nr:transcriptional repressor LexA [Heliorestis acidaminivorans]KAB2954235.1 transcriptional repressor LexA [Heliorestis acidaminivorans]
MVEQSNSKRKELSERQKHILAFIRNESQRRGYPPSVREIGEAVGLSSSSTVHGHLHRLEKLGYIRRDPSKPRAIEVLFNNGTNCEQTLVEVPKVNKIVAGKPLFTSENRDGSFTLPYDFIQTDQVFMIPNRGESMVEAGIYDGDLLVVQKQEEAQNGDVVVVWLSEDVTVKQIFQEKDHYRLQPANKEMDPILMKEVNVIGKVIAVIRKLS